MECRVSSRVPFTEPGAYEPSVLADYYDSLHCSDVSSCTVKKAMFERRHGLSMRPDATRTNFAEMIARQVEGAADALAAAASDTDGRSTSRGGPSCSSSNCSS